MTKKKKTKKKDKQTIILTIIFILLSVLVIALVIDFIVVKNRVDSEKKININIPLLEKKAEASVSINISNMKKDETLDYVFRVRNYQEKINKKSISYNIVLSSESNVDYKLVENNKELKLVDGEIKNLKLKANKKEDKIYTITIKANENIKENSSVLLNVFGN